jgi:toxin ParE1/3/4
MKVVYTATAVNDLAEISDWLAVHYPAIAPAAERRIRAVVARIGRWPGSARRSAERPAVRVVPIGRYPYKIFYRVTSDAVEILSHPPRGAPTMGRTELAAERFNCWSGNDKLQRISFHDISPYRSGHALPTETTVTLTPARRRSDWRPACRATVPTRNKLRRAAGRAKSPRAVRK